jgi:hypothetical protein
LPTISSCTLRPLSPISIQHVSASSAVFSTSRLTCLSTTTIICAKNRRGWFGSAANIRKIPVKNLTLAVGNDVITPVAVVRDLSVYLDAELTVKHHINRVTSNCFFQLRRLRQIRRVADPDVTKRLMSALVLSRLDYCNAALAGLQQTTLRPLQRAQNAAARLVTNTGSRDHITPAMKELHWLPVNQRIKFKLCLMMHIIHTKRCTDYMHNLVSMTRYQCHENWISFGQWPLIPEAKSPNEVW